MVASASDARAVVVHPNTDMYGSDRMLLRTLLALRESGIEFELHVPGRGDFTARLDELSIPWRLTGFPVLRRTLLSPRGLLLLAWQAVSSLPRMLRAVRGADVVYVNTVNCGLWLVLARLLRVPAVCHVRENEPQMPRAQRMLLLAPLLLADLVVCNSRSTQSWVESSFAALRSRTRVVYNGLDLLPGPVAAPFSRLPRVRLLVIGRLSWRKGQDVAIRALAKVRNGGVDGTLTLVGDHYPGYEQYVEDLRALARELDVTDEVRFAGFHLNLEQFWADADIALVPSLLEPFGNVAVEAMAAGVPVIASDVQGLAEIVEDGTTGQLVQAGDDTELSAAILSMSAAPERGPAMTAQAAEQAVERFSLGRYNAEIVQLLRDTARGARRADAGS